MSAKLELSVEQAAEWIRSDHPPQLLDVREASEYAICHLENGRLLSQPLLEEILLEWDEDTPILCYCHHGIRSLHTAAYLAHKGFSAVKSMHGGIDVWSQKINPTVPRY